MQTTILVLFFFFLTFYTRKNVNSLRYADDTTLLAQSEDKLKNRLMRVQEESEKAGLILKIQKTKVMVSSTITSWQIGGERVKKETDFYFLGIQNHCR